MQRMQRMQRNARDATNVSMQHNAGNQRNTTQRNATQRNATQRNATSLILSVSTNVAYVRPAAF